MTLRQFLHWLRSPFFGTFIMIPSFHFLGNFSFCHISWNSGSRISDPATFPFFAVFMASTIFLFEGGLMLIGNSAVGDGLTVSSSHIGGVGVLSISSRYSFHLWICPSIDVMVLLSLSLLLYHSVTRATYSFDSLRPVFTYRAYRHYITETDVEISTS